jgi:hypothetical protein
MGEHFAPVHVLLLLVLLLPMVVIYFFPAIVAGVRRVRNFWWITAINIVLGWTVLGWIVALVLAIGEESKIVRTRVRRRRRRHRRGL